MIYFFVYEATNIIVIHPKIYDKFLHILANFPRASVLATTNINIRYERRILIETNLTIFKLNISVLFIVNGIH